MRCRAPIFQAGYRLVSDLNQAVSELNETDAVLTLEI